MAGDPHDQSSEDQGHEDALDHLQEDVGDDLQVLGLGRESPPQH